ncbi:MAG: amino acid ABC transporter permease [Chloroflexi bacterium]|nr:amino acid ABC transporter permease [Chloroflexota bacterium]
MADSLLLSLRYTLLLAALALGFGSVIGMLVALLRLSKIRAISVAAGLYINIFRGIPQMVYLVWLYFGISMVTRVSLEPIVAAGLCLATQYGGYLAEIFRCGIEAIDRGQSEAAKAMGLDTGQTYRYIILPQAIRIIIPPMGNMWVGAIKDSALVSYLGVMELTRTAMLQANISWRPFEFYTATALIYVVLVWLSSRGVALLEKRMAYA